MPNKFKFKYEPALLIWRVLQNISKRKLLFHYERLDKCSNISLKKSLYFHICIFSILRIIIISKYDNGSKRVKLTQLLFWFNVIYNWIFQFSISSYTCNYSNYMRNQGFYAFPYLPRVTFKDSSYACNCCSYMCN